MANKILNKLMEMMPEGKRKEELRNKLRQASKPQGSKGGLHDEFSLDATGHILIQQIDEKGEPVGVLADQDNLVVNGSEEILLRAFSGDPERSIYKNRKPITEEVYHVALDKIIDSEDGQNTLVVNQNDLWKAVNDEDFEVEYSYYPNVLFVKEEESLIPGEKAFSVSTESSPDSAPIAAELYSGFTNLFIGLGDGKNYEVSLDDKRLEYKGTFTDEDGKKTEEKDAEITFSEKISNFELAYESGNDTGKIEIYINDSLKETIDTSDASLGVGETRVTSKEISELDHESQSTVRIKFIGSLDESVPYVKIKSIKWDALSEERNSLIHEFENFTTEFDTPAVYNTTSIAPYTVKLEHTPLKEKTVQVSYNDIEFEQVSSKEDVDEGKYFVDHKNGVIEFNRALTNVLIKYHTTGQNIEVKKVNQMEDFDVEISVVDETPVGTIDGSNTVFTLENKDITRATVKVNESNLNTEDFTLDKEKGIITINQAPVVDDKITVRYTYFESVNKMVLPFAVDTEKHIVIYDQNEEELSKVETRDELGSPGVFYISESNTKVVYISKSTLSSETLKDVEVHYHSKEQPGIPTNYKRSVILKPKDVNQYPWYALDKGTIQFVAEFPKDSPQNAVTIREMGLFDGPRKEDKIRGFKDYPVKAFSLVRVGDSIKNESTGLRVTWTITLKNSKGEHFKGGQ